VSGSAELLLAAGADRMSQFASEGGRW
jgi:hypothetical protein